MHLSADLSNSFFQTNKEKSIDMYHMLTSKPISIHNEKFSRVKLPLNYIATMNQKASQTENSVLAKCKTLYSSIQDVHVLTPQCCSTLHIAFMLKAYFVTRFVVHFQYQTRTISH